MGVTFSFSSTDVPFNYQWPLHSSSSILSWKYNKQKPTPQYQLIIKISPELATYQLPLNKPQFHKNIDSTFVTSKFLILLKLHHLIQLVRLKWKSIIFFPLIHLLLDGFCFDVFEYWQWHLEAHHDLYSDWCSSWLYIIISLCPIISPHIFFPVGIFKHKFYSFITPHLPPLGCIHLKWKFGYMHS